MRIPLPFYLVLALGLCAGTARAASLPNPEIVALGQDTYSLTRWADTGFVRNTDKLKEQALEDAAAYCAKLHKELKVVSTSTKHPLVPLTGFAHAKVVFKALDPNSPELHATAAAIDTSSPATMAPAAPPRSATDALYDDLMKLDDLRKRGILTDEEFQAQKKKLLEKSN
ncbi:MAG TPA: SHOCT domain-containing protein [Opitutaceae bacterium]|nr:SHOCT domain-containing protein [Opitutaceae bacterium]